MKPLPFAFCALLSCLSKTSAQQNLIPNFNFADPTPLKGWRVDFPYQDWYKKNVTYVKQTTMGGKRCAVIDLPPGIAGNEGGKIETAVVQCEPGASYRAEVEAYLPDFSAKVHAEVFAANPRPELAAPPDPNAKNPNNSIFRIPEGDGHPALIMITANNSPIRRKARNGARSRRRSPYRWSGT